MKELPKQYIAKDHEDAIYKLWEESGAFKPSGKGNPFSIIMPPPNANGSLHVGHAVFVTLEDIMTRYNRMKGIPSLWLPGADHAGFETQVVYDKKLEKEKRDRSKLSREELWKEIWNFTQENKEIMESQLRKLGSSCDWSREVFTLNPDVVKVVYHTFKELYDDGLIYRANRIVNWCTKHQTTLSDLEIKYIDQVDPLYYMQYGPLTLATVRPETKFGDTAIAVHPKDKRYKELIGKEIEIKTLLGPAKIKVIADEFVDPKFGTGAVKVTPAHDPNDFEIWQRHKDEIPGPRVVINQYGKMDLLSHWPDNEKAKKYDGLPVLEARKIIAEDMEKEGLLKKIEANYSHAVSTCYKCQRIVEPRILPQWYVAMTKKPKTGTLSLRDSAVKAVKSGEVKFVPKRMEKVFMHWMKELRDWNISRQIVWGIRIPVWNKGDQVHVGEEPPEKNGWKQDPDVLDTWFSSGQWPLATLLANGEKKPNKGKFKLPWLTDDFEKFYPTSVMETGWDILFFWVARMVMFGLYTTGKAPFKHVYLHGLVRDKDRQKMSKSKGNVLDPLGVSATYGTDALRIALVIGNTAGNDTIISEDKIRGYRNFANKIWNVSRFVIMNLDDNNPSKPTKLKKEDKEIINEFNAAIEDITKYLEKFDFNHAADTAYHYFWHTFADKIIESQKSRLQGKDKPASQYLLYTVLTTLLKTLHPFMPFVTEAVWQELFNKKSLLISEKWPKNK